MHYSFEQDDNVGIFTLKESRLDATIAGDIKAEFLIVTSQPNMDALVIDLSNVESCDSTGLSSLLLARRLMEEHDAPVLLAGIQPVLMNLMKLTQLDRIFPIFASLEEAYADLQGE